MHVWLKKNTKGKPNLKKKILNYNKYKLLTFTWKNRRTSENVLVHALVS